MPEHPSSEQNQTKVKIRVVGKDFSHFPGALTALLLILSAGDCVSSSREIQSKALPTFLLELSSVLN